MKIKITPEEFVKVWQESDSLKEVAEKCGINVNAVNSRAEFYRRKGINLKRRRDPVNLLTSDKVAALNKLIKSL